VKLHAVLQYMQLHEVMQHMQFHEAMQKQKYHNINPCGPLHFLPVSQGPWFFSSFDFITDLPNSNGKGLILLVVY